MGKQKNKELIRFEQFDNYVVLQFKSQKSATLWKSKLLSSIARSKGFRFSSLLQRLPIIDKLLTCKTDYE